MYQILVGVCPQGRRALLLFTKWKKIARTLCSREASVSWPCGPYNLSMAPLDIQIYHDWVFYISDSWMQYWIVECVFIADSEFSLGFPPTCDCLSLCCCLYWLRLWGIWPMQQNNMLKTVLSCFRNFYLDPLWHDQQMNWCVWKSPFSRALGREILQSITILCMVVPSSLANSNRLQNHLDTGSGAVPIVSTCAWNLHKL